jgi:hypothetical protein
MRHVVLLFLLMVAALGQRSSVPYAPDSDGPGPTFTNEGVNLSYPGTYSSIRKVDFRNFKFAIFDKAGKPAQRFFLKNGHYKHDERDSHSSLDLDSVYYLNTFPSSKGGSALVLYRWFAAGGSSSQGGIAEVFTVWDDQLRSVQEIDWETHFEAGGPTDSFDSSTNTLVIRSAHYIPGDSHCCVSAMDIVTFRWDGSRFIQSGIRTELSEYGRKEGKTLPR